MTHLVFDLLDRSGIDDPLVDWAQRLDQVPPLALQVLGAMTFVVETNFAENYVTRLFKNISKCRDLVAVVKQDLESMRY